jgi:hypothetical protein
MGAYVRRLLKVIAVWGAPTCAEEDIPFSSLDRLLNLFVTSPWLTTSQILGLEPHRNGTRAATARGSAPEAPWKYGDALSPSK